ncbi:unnamed protein product [Brassicogethes aeneus]|uniref:Uncharacterized protein n=1 Tax=Brassicogethes aeneus TaxID=1431903 RepID=A0A9P0BM25_BRAAE|nr:unnamed protein product [Brassicogethes aeneus]
MSESAYNSPMVHRRLTESCCSSPARSIGSRITDILTDSDGEDDILFTEVPGTPEQTIMAGWLKFRDNKKIECHGILFHFISVNLYRRERRVLCTGRRQALGSN